MAAKYTLKINQGESYSQIFQWVQMDRVTPVDLTGYTGRCQIRSAPGAPGIVSVVSVDIIDAVNGRFSLSLTDTQTSNIPTSGKFFADITQYVFDVELVSPLGTVSRVLNGYVEISPEVTR